MPEKINKLVWKIFVKQIFRQFSNSEFLKTWLQKFLEHLESLLFYFGFWLAIEEL